MFTIPLIFIVWKSLGFKKKWSFSASMYGDPGARKYVGMGTIFYYYKLNDEWKEPLSTNENNF